MAASLQHFSNFAEKKVKELSEVTPGLLLEFIQWRSEGKSYSTQKHAVWCVKEFFTWLKLCNRSESNPSSDLRYPKKHPRERLPVYLESDQLKRLLESSYKEDSLGDFAIIALINSTGLRPGDMDGLTRFNFRLEDQMLAGHVKGNVRKRTVLSDSCTAILQTFLSQRTDSEEALLLNSRGKPATKSYIQRVVKRAGERAELPFQLTCNILRHTFATHSARRHGRPITKALMGHNKMATTEVYTHLCPEVFKPLMNSHPHNDPEISYER